MKKKIKIFSSENPYELEEVVNGLLKHMEGKLHDVIFYVGFDPHTNLLEYTCVLVFTPEGNDEKKDNVRKKISKVMREFKKRELHSGSKEGPEVTNPAQAKAIALSEAKKSKK